MIEKFQPAISQLSRPSEEAYDKFLTITEERLDQAETDSPVALDVPEENRQNTLIDIQEDTVTTIAPAIEDFLEGGQLARLENTIGETVSTALLLAMLLAIGGRQKLKSHPTPTELILDTRNLISGQLRAARAFADNVANGQLTPGRIRAQARRRALGVRSGFSSAAIIDRMASNFHNEGLRRLTSQHPCPDCPQYDTNGEFIPLNQVVPIATFCVCQSRCKCRIITRFNPRRALGDLLSGNLIGRVQQRREFMTSAEADYLRRHGWTE